MLSSGSVVRQGEGNGVVLLTGAKTYFGRTTELVKEAKPVLHIEKVVARVVRWLFLIVGVLLSRGGRFVPGSGGRLFCRWFRS